MQSVTHIAGNIVDINGRTIQRCSLCGDKLIDSKNMEIPQAPNGQVLHVGTWEVGRLVRHYPGDPEHWVLIEETLDAVLPLDSCIALVEEP